MPDLQTKICIYFLTLSIIFTSQIISVSSQSDFKNSRFRQFRKITSLCSNFRFNSGKLQGDNGYKISVDQLDDQGLQTNRTYIVTLTSNNPVEKSFQYWTLWSLDENGNPCGEFMIQDAYQLHDQCSNKISSTSWTKQTSLAVEWKTSLEIETDCVIFRAVVYIDQSTKFASDGSLTTKICKSDAAAKHCCACGNAAYEVTFDGLWSQQTHPMSWPPVSLVHWSNIAGAVHSRNFTLWRNGHTASEGISHLALYGSSSIVEKELFEQMQSSDEIREIVVMDGRWSAKLNVPTKSNVTTSPKHYLLSLASMFGPSPDWFSGIDSLSFCNSNCTWKEYETIELRPYDAGVDTGTTYMSNKKPEIPQLPIVQISKSKHSSYPLFNADGVIPPMAKLTVRRLETYGTQCPDGSLNFQIKSQSASELQKFQNSISKKLPSIPKSKSKRNNTYQVKIIDPTSLQYCAFSNWSQWTPCSTTNSVRTRTRYFLNPKKAAHLSCPIELVEEQQCSNGHLNVIDEHDGSCLTSQWTEWSPCSAKCGKGIKTRNRQLLSQNPNCISKITLNETRECIGKKRKCSTVLKLDMFEKKRVCMQPKLAGTCGKNEVRYYLDFEARKCKQFSYSGCDGNENNFESIEDCENVCDILLLGRTSFGVDSRCVTLPWSEWSKCSNSCGSGVETRHREYKSKPLALGICGEDLDESRPCVGTLCSTDTSIFSNKIERTDICQTLVEPGPCSESITRFYYDTITESCMSFKYGGCLGNLNNFNTRQQCEDTCSRFMNKTAQIFQSNCGSYIWLPWSQCQRMNGLNNNFVQVRSKKLIQPSVTLRPDCHLFEKEEEKKFCTNSFETGFNERICPESNILYSITRKRFSKHKGFSLIHWLDGLAISHSNSFNLQRFIEDANFIFDEYLEDGYIPPLYRELKEMQLESDWIMDVQEFSPLITDDDKIIIMANTEHTMITVMMSALCNQSVFTFGKELNLLNQSLGCEWQSGVKTSLELLSFENSNFDIKDAVETDLFSMPQVSSLNFDIAAKQLNDMEYSETRALDPRCTLGDWTIWSQCSARCAKCNSKLREKRVCFSENPMCKISPRCWTTEWSSWSPCSSMCGIGTTTRVRHFAEYNPDPNYHKNCKIPLIEKKLCESYDHCHSYGDNNTNVSKKKNQQDKRRRRKICALPLKDGSPCRSSLTRFYFNSTLEICLLFKFGGCNGNANNFETYEECRQFCTVL
ncbi:hypothetical protein GJ496_005926 [Pomphorhynchus laevis]|nr:hypothetical protein GJ496_005926 [Pomphorhynchus laevis]